MKKIVILSAVVALLVLLGFGLFASSMECVQTGTNDPEVKWRYDCHFELFPSKHPLGSSRVVKRRFGLNWRWSQQPEFASLSTDGQRG